jgi:hypothetical protein
MENIKTHATPFSLNNTDDEKDLYLRMQELERELELLTI